MVMASIQCRLSGHIFNDVLELFDSEICNKFPTLDVHVIFIHGMFFTCAEGASEAAVGGTAGAAGAGVGPTWLVAEEGEYR